MTKVLQIMLAALLTGCVSLTSISTSSIPADRSQPVDATETRFLVLMLNFDNEYVDRLTKQLAQECPHGRVEGILTKQEFITYFPLLAHEVRVTASGYCVDQKTR